MAPAATPATPRVLSGCHAACPRCGLHNAALCAIACFSRHAPFACNGSGFAPHSRRYANLAPATSAPACAGALNRRWWSAKSARISLTNSGRAMCHRAPCALRLPKSSVGALRAPPPGTFPRPPCGLPATARITLLVSVSAASPHPPQGAPQYRKTAHRCFRRPSSRMLSESLGSRSAKGFALHFTAMQNAFRTVIQALGSPAISRRTAP